MDFVGVGFEGVGFEGEDLVGEDFVGVDLDEAVRLRAGVAEVDGVFAELRGARAGDVFAVAASV